MSSPGKRGRGGKSKTPSKLPERRKRRSDPIEEPESRESKPTLLRTSPRKRQKSTSEELQPSTSLNLSGESGGTAEKMETEDIQPSTSSGSSREVIEGMETDELSRSKSSSPKTLSIEELIEQKYASKAVSWEEFMEEADIQDPFERRSIDDVD